MRKRRRKLRSSGVLHRSLRYNVRMKVYKSRYGLLPGSKYEEVVHSARREFIVIRKLTKRQPYVKSKYFKTSKIFVTIFWDHLDQKHRNERTKRLKFYKAAIDLLRNTTNTPEVIPRRTDPNILLYRFYGVTKEGVHFCVQIKEDMTSGRKDFMSVFDKKPGQ
jgi:hypothetical protein